MIISFTGHRPTKIGGYKIPNDTYNRIESNLIEKLKELKPEKALSGMALGFDQLAANVCIELKIPFIACIPFKDQESKWPTSSQYDYTKLVEQASEVVIVSEGGYSPEKMQIRNEYMVDNSDLLISCWNGNPSGTGNCVHYANKTGKQVLNVF